MAPTPKMKRILKILDPITLPSAMSVFPFRALASDTTSSGAEVPKETMVSPITIGAMRSLVARLDDPSTRKFAPLIRIISPVQKRINSIIYFIQYISCGTVVI